MGATASINYAASKKYKADPIEVKFSKMVKYDDGDEKPFKDELVTKKQPLSLLATAIRILERKPKEQLTVARSPANYAKQLRPRSAYIVLKKPTQSSTTLNASNQTGSQSNRMTTQLPQQKQLKTKQNLYMSLIHPSSSHDPRLGMTVPSRLRTPIDYHLPIRPPKANTLPRYSAASGKRLRVNQKLYMDMIRPVMASPQYLKLGASRSGPPTPLSDRTLSRQSQQSKLIPRPTNGQILRRLDPNSGQQQKAAFQPKYKLRKDEFTPLGRPSTAQTIGRGCHPASLSNSSLSHRNHLPRISQKKKDNVSLNSSLNSRSQIPRAHPDNITPLYFRKSLAFTPNYERNEFLSRPLSGMHN